MDFDELVTSMATFPAELRTLVETASPACRAFRPNSEAWSITGVLHHLADEEEADFRVRLRSTLETPAAPWPPIDPAGWAVERRYEEGDPFEALHRFERERTASIAWLRSLERPDWTLAHEHPSLGPLRAEELFCAWALHDRLHLAQVVRRTVEHTQALAGDVSCRYAQP